MENPICHVCKKEKKPYLVIMDSNILSFIKYYQAREDGEICQRCDQYFAMTGEFKDATDYEFDVAKESVKFAMNMLKWWEKDKKLFAREDRPLQDKQDNKREWEGTETIARWFRERHAK